MNFVKDVYKVDETATQEILLFQSKLMVAENIVEPLNSGDRTSFSLLTGSSFSAKIMDEKKNFVIKTCD